ncbi:MAG: CHAT domain-containing protein [Moorea sp. SIO2B7]|nr:CHAT domain-containing protein [Moorena sp. SIO2B7]
MGEKDNGLLTSSEILDMKLNAELIVLSACDKRRGDLTAHRSLIFKLSYLIFDVKKFLYKAFSRLKSD